MPARYPVNSPTASAEAAVIAIRNGFRSTATARQTPANTLTGRKTKAAPMKARNHMLVYPTVSMLNVPVVHSTSPVAIKAALINSGLTRKIF